MPTLDPSLKRFLTPLIAMALAAMQAKLGISENLALAILTLAGGYIFTSKSGEVLIAQAEAKGAIAAADVTSVDQANAVITKALQGVGFTLPPGFDVHGIMQALLPAAAPIVVAPVPPAPVVVAAAVKK